MDGKGNVGEWASEGALAPTSAAALPGTRDAYASIYARWLSHPWVLPGLAIALAVLTRFFDLNEFGLWRDDFASIPESTTRFGQNHSSLVYLVVLRAVQTIGHDPTTLRLPAVVFGVCTVLVLYLLGSALVDRRTGLVAAFLLAISPLGIDQSQEVRFYSLFLLGGLVALYALTRLVQNGITWQGIVFLVAADLFCLGTALVGVLVIGIQIVSLIMVTAAPGGMARRVGILSALAVLCGLLISLPWVRAWAFDLLIVRGLHDRVVYTHPAGIHFDNFRSIITTFFQFTIGKRVYPGWFGISVPARLLALALGCRGLWSQRRNRLFIGILIPQLVLGPVLLYLVAEPLMSANTPQLMGGSAENSERYVTPVLGLYLILLGAGVTSWRIRASRFLSFVALLIVMGIGLAAYYRPVWTVDGLPPDWPRVISLMNEYGTPGTAVLVNQYDGRDYGPEQYYFAPVERSQHLKTGDLRSAATVARVNAPRIIAISYFGDPVRGGKRLDALQDRYSVRDGFTRNPLFAYVLDRNQTFRSPTANAGSSWRRIPIPIELNDVEYADVPFPVLIRAPRSNQQLTSFSEFPLSPSSRNRVFRLPAGTVVHHVLLATSLENASALPSGSPIATLTLYGPFGEKVLTLRKGEQVDEWPANGSSDARPVGSKSSFMWTNLTFPTGGEVSRSGYRTYRPGIALTILPVNSSDRVFVGSSVHYLAPSGTLRLWLMAAR